MMHLTPFQIYIIAAVALIGFVNLALIAWRSRRVAYFYYCSYNGGKKFEHGVFMVRAKLDAVDAYGEITKRICLRHGIEPCTLEMKSFTKVS